MSSPITKQTLEHLAKLARINLEDHEEEKLLRDLQTILEHFEELKSVDTANVEPMKGGTNLMSIFREDGGSADTNRGSGTEQFPEAESGFLKVPPVFD